MTPVGFVHHPFFRRHQTGTGHPEQAMRLEVIESALEKNGLREHLVPLPFTAAGLRDLTLVHEEAYVELVRRAAAAGCGFIGDPDTHLCRESYDVAALAVGGVLAACDAVMAQRVRRAFCAVRPPGHHAERDRAMGFCLFNNVATAAEHLIQAHGLNRVAIVDFDVHHGSGTQQIFEHRSEVFYLSLHEHPLSLHFPGTGWVGEIGSGAGRGYTCNILAPHGCDGSRYLHLFREKALPHLVRFEPQFLLVSAGFDAQCTESIAHLNLVPENFSALTAELVALADRYCRGRVVSVLEGGYELGGLGANVAAHVAALC